YVAAIIDEASTVEADPESMFDHAYAELPPELQRQREGFLSMLEAYGDGAFLRE
ncbi:MAG: pyruvate dehydrogenase (acetyl-transferring) E1 component subunit alpha, partial [Haloplanus sp.]